ncbi:discoidin domain-containing protein, partial [Streptacidiphilus griseoplanus]|uniref:discoidin domain-containing protein n=1 Tax=Peterkaempfera griseoplana TaxID=66896 RepID=UPI000A94CC08
PQWIQVDLGCASQVNRLVLKLPPATAWAARTETFQVQGSTDGSSWSTLSASAGHSFDPATGNTATVSFTPASARYLKLTFTANTGWPAAQLSELQAYADGGSTTPPPSTTPPSGNLAQGRPATASGTSQNYGPGNAVDGDASSYWESANNAFPQWIQVDLGSSQSVGRLVLKLPPATAWAARTETFQVQGSTDGSSWSTLSASAGHSFDPATGNTATVSFTPASARYLRLTFTANTGWPAAQLSELQAYSS